MRRNDIRQKLTDGKIIEPEHEKPVKYKQKSVICVRFSGFTDGKIIGGEKNGME